jgi:hypothetical protein
MSEIDECIRRGRSLWDIENAPECCRAGYPPRDDTERSGSTGAPDFADVEILNCSECGRLWLDYFYEFESFSGSSTRYRGLITSEIAQMLRDGAVGSIAVFKALPWYFKMQAAGKIRTSGEPSFW